MPDYCEASDKSYFMNQPLLTVISEWFLHNVEMEMDISTIILSCIILLLVWVTFKICFRIIKSMVRPIIFSIICLIILYTKQFSHSENFGDFIVNALSNAVEVIVKIIEIVFKIIGIEYQ